MLLSDEAIMTTPPTCKSIQEQELSAIIGGWPKSSVAGKVITHPDGSFLVYPEGTEGLSPRWFRYDQNGNLLFARTRF